MQAYIVQYKYVLHMGVYVDTYGNMEIATWFSTWGALRDFDSRDSKIPWGKRVERSEFGREF